MIMAALCACAEMDIKKIVALSTLSQLGVIIVALSIGKKDFCFFHLTTHALFKALLFLSVGVGLHSVFGTQDFRSFSAMARVIFWPTSALIVSNLALLGFPFMAGFYSKDMILENFYSNNLRALIAMAFFSGVGLTTAYSIKVLGLAFMARTSPRPTAIAAGGFRWQLKVPMAVLGLRSVIAGATLASSLSVVVVAATDKLLPLVMITTGIYIGAKYAEWRNPFLSSIWNLTPRAQSVASAAVQSLNQQSFDAG